jgi:O-antigen/teichoic acid export membrane protein
MVSSNLSEVIRKNIVGSLGIKLISVVVSLAYVPLLISYLGSEEYGIWVVISTTLTWISFFDVGLGNGLRNRLTEAISASNFDRAKALISTSYALLGIIFLLVAGIFVLIVDLLNWNSILSLDTISASELKLLIGMVAVSFCVRFIVQLIQPILFAVHKSALSSIFPVLSNIIGIVLIYLIRYLDCPKLLTAAFIISVLPIVSFIIGTIFLFTRSLHFIKPSFKHIDFSIAGDVLSLGFKFFFLQVATNIINTASSFIIIKILGPTYVTEYDVLFRYYMMALLVNEIVLAPLWSAFTEAFAKRDFDWARKVLRKLNLFSVVQIIGIFIMFLISDFVIDIWIGKNFMVSKDLSFILMILISLRIVMSPFVRIINGSGKLSFSIMVNVFCCILFVVLAILFGQSSLGTIGVVLAACIVRFILLTTSIIQVKHLLSGNANGIFNT